MLRSGFAVRLAAIGSAGVALACLALVPIVDAATPTAGDDGGAFGALWMASWVGFPLVGATLATRRPRNPLGWLMIGISLGLAGAILCEGLARYHVLVRPIPGGGFFTWVAFLSGAPGFVLLPFLVLLFPSGKVGSRRWRRLGVFAAAAATSVIGLLAIRPRATLTGVDLVNPIGVPALGPVVETLVPVFGTSLTFCGMFFIGNAVVRFRRSSGAERQQFRWFAYAAAIFPVGMGSSILFRSFLPPVALDALVAATFFISLNGMAAAIGIAVTRYRLYDIDRVVSRTVTYAVLSGALIGVYAVGVLGVGALLPGEPSDVLVAASTLAVAAMFRPLQTRIKRTVDRHFNRSNYEAADLVEDFGRRLRDRVHLDDVARELRSATSATLEPTSVGIWLRTSEVPT